MDETDDGAVLSDFRETINFESAFLYPIIFNSSLRVKSIDFLICKDLENLPHADPLKKITREKMNPRKKQDKVNNCE